MLDDYSIYIDPEEDEVFFTALLEKPIITISKPNNSLADLSLDEDDACIGEGASNNYKNDCVELTSPLHNIDNFCEEEENVLKLKVLTSNDSENCGSKERCIEINSDFPKENGSININELVRNVAKINTSRFNDSSENKENCASKDYLKTSINISQSAIIANTNFKEINQENDTKISEFKTPLKKSPLKLYNEKSSSKYGSGRKPRRISKMTDISLNNDGAEFELSADVNESLISWSSVDVNVQLENLMADLDFDELDNEPAEDELLMSSTPLKSENDKQLELSWTPGGLNFRFGSTGTSKDLPCSGSDIIRKIPSINIIEASPVVSQPPTTDDIVFNRPVAPIRFRPVYSSAKKVVATTSGSSSGSTNSFTTPGRTPHSKTKGNYIPSNIPKPSAKKLTAKSLQFSHIENPISKYIYDKSTPLVSNVKGSKLTSNIPGPSPHVSKYSGKSPSASKQLPHARYQKGIPFRQEKTMESRLPRLGSNQMQVVGAVPTARVISHNARQTDVSVLVSSPAKINPKNF